MTDRMVVDRKMANLEVYLRQVREFSGISPSEYQEDWKTQRIVERTLQMLVETCVDIANHIVSDRGMRAPTSYADTFTVLKENGVIDGSLHDSLNRMVKFRNIVVHQYEDVEAAIVLAILKNRLSDIERFRDAIRRLLGEGDAQ